MKAAVTSVTSLALISRERVYRKITAGHVTFVTSLVSAICPPATVSASETSGVIA